MKTTKEIYLDAEWQKRQWKRQRRQSEEVGKFISRTVMFLENCRQKDKDLQKEKSDEKKT